MGAFTDQIVFEKGSCTFLEFVEYWIMYKSAKRKVLNTGTFLDWVLKYYLQLLSFTDVINILPMSKKSREGSQ